MHPRNHFLLTTLVAAALCPRQGRCVLAFWAGGVLADSDHLLWHTRHTGRLDPLAAWAHFAGNGAGERPAERLLFHRWRVIGAGLALAPISPWIAGIAMGLAFHRLLDDLADRGNPWLFARRVRRRSALHEAVFRRAHYRCESCGSTAKLEAHHRVQRTAGGRDALANFVALCVPCHQLAHQAAAGISDKGLAES